MKTKAKVVLAFSSTSMVAVETASGEITVFELLGSETVRRGHVLIGHWSELDNQVVYNESRDQNLDVFILDCGCKIDAVKEQYFTSRPEALSLTN